MKANMDSYNEKVVIMKASKEKIRSREGSVFRKDGGHKFGGKSGRKSVQVGA
jgi:hypothetical protein